MKIFAAASIAGRRHEPLRLPYKVGIGIIPRIDYRRRCKAEVVDLHHNFVTRRADGAWSRCDSGDVGTEDVELRHVRAAGAGDFVFAVAGWIQHTVKRSETGN